MVDTAAVAKADLGLDTGRRWPDFFIVGAPRCATTFLYASLRRHDRIFMPERKEQRYFCLDLDSPGAGWGGGQGTRSIDDQHAYLAQFSPAQPGQLIGEATATYLFSTAAAAGIKRVTPDARIIISLRDPVAQMRSFHALRHATGREPLEFEAALADEAGRLPGGKANRPVTFAGGERLMPYRAVASYAEQVRRYFECFGRDQILILLYEDVTRQPQAAMDQLCEFLGIEPIPPAPAAVNTGYRVRSRRLMLLTRRLALFEPARRVAPAWLRHRLRGTREVVRRLNADVRAAPTRQPLPVAVRDRLRAEMRPDVERLSDLLGRDMVAYWWG